MPTERATEGRNQAKAGIPEYVKWAIVLVVMIALMFATHNPPREPGYFRFLASGREEGTPVYSEPGGEDKVVGMLEDWHLVLGLERSSGWAELQIIRGDLPWPSYAKLEDLTPASREALRSNYRDEEGWLGTGEGFSALVMESDSAYWTVLRGWGHYYWVYRENEEGAPKLEFARVTNFLPPRLLVAPLVQTVRPPHGEGAPSIAEFWPPLTLRLWRWDGVRFSHSFPARWEEASALAAVVLLCHFWWVTALVGFLVLWALWLRTVFTPASGALAFLIWAGSFATLWGFPVFVVLNVAGLVYMVKTPRIGFDREIAAVLVLAITSLLLMAIALYIIIVWGE